ncbi:MAG: LysR family transcriptional regulator [Lysobacter sp.]
MNNYESMLLLSRIMDLSDLQVFRCVAEAGGITRAAERLHRVPSNVSTRIRQLEEDLGVQLFLREGKRIVITPAGQVLLGYAERILALADDARAAVQDSTPRGRLGLGSMESTAATRLPGPLAEYHLRFPEVALELSTGSTRQLVAQVLDGKLDAAFAADPAHHERLESVAAFSEELVLAAEAGHPRIRSPKDLSRPTMLAFGSGCTYRRRFEEWFGASGADPERIIELASYHAILGCTVAGMGVALLPRAILDIFPERARLSIHELPAPMRRSETALIWRKGAKSANVVALAELLVAG